jgi:hypothetical protein
VPYRSVARGAPRPPHDRRGRSVPARANAVAQSLLQNLLSFIKLISLDFSPLRGFIRTRWRHESRRHRRLNRGQEKPRPHFADLLPMKRPDRYGVAVGDSVVLVPVAAAVADGPGEDDGPGVVEAFGDATLLGVALALAGAGVPVGVRVTVEVAMLPPFPDALVGVVPVAPGVAGVAARVVAVLRAALTGVEARTVCAGGTGPLAQPRVTITRRLRPPPRARCPSDGRTRGYRMDFSSLVSILSHSRIRSRWDRSGSLKAERCSPRLLRDGACHLRRARWPVGWLYEVRCNVAQDSNPDGGAGYWVLLPALGSEPGLLTSSGLSRTSS